MKVAKSLLLGSAAVIATVAGAQAADLPTRKAAPVQYVKICDAYGAGFFYIPGTDTCLRVGGLVMADWAVSNTPDRFNLAVGTPAGYGIFAAGFGGGAGPLAAFIPGKSRDAVASLALGRIELDARTQSPWGTVRTFLRVDSYFGSGAVANTGGMPGVAAASLGTLPARETTMLNKAFIQFAGITMGRIQSMFDFYADAVGYTAHPGSNNTVNGIAYTATFGGGFSATLAVEDEVSHRSANSSVIGAAGLPVVGATFAQFNGTRMPDVVANLRLDQPWGSAQIMGALHSNNRSLWSGAALLVGGLPVTQPQWAVASTSQLGFAIGGGLKFNLDSIAPGDVLWLQAIYAKGAIGYVSGSNMAMVNGVDTSTSYGIGLGRISSGNGWGGASDVDCVWTYGGTCEQSKAFAITAALRHYWSPTVSSTLSGSYYSVSYGANSTNPLPAALAVGAAAGSTFLGVTNYRQTILATGLEWNPVRNFGIGAEIAWTHGTTSRPVGLGNDLALALNGTPFKATNDLIRGRVRMYRAF